MQIKWWGHACFTITGSDGFKVMTDPFDPAIGYSFPAEAVQLVTVSHQHHDHNAVDRVAGNPRVITEAGDYQVGPVKVTGFPTYHDSARGVRRGSNTIYLLEWEGLRLLHTGDLGHFLYQDTVDALGRVDVLFLPVGGVYTVDSGVAASVVRQLNPPVVIPMHYQTPVLKLGARLDGVEKFTQRMSRVERQPVLEVSAGNLPAETTAVVLEY